MVITCIVIIEYHNGMSTLKIPMVLYSGHYSITWPPVYLEPWPQFHIQWHACSVSSTSLCWPT